MLSLKRSLVISLGLLAWGVFRVFAEGFPSYMSDAAVHWAIVEEIRQGRIFPPPYHGIIFSHLLTAILSQLTGSITLAMVGIVDLCLFSQVLWVFKLTQKSFANLLRPSGYRALLMAWGLLLVGMDFFSLLRMGFYSQIVGHTIWMWLIYFLIVYDQPKSLRSAIVLLAVAGVATLAYPISSVWMFLFMAFVVAKTSLRLAYKTTIVVLLGAASLYLFRGLVGRLYLSGAIEDARSTYWTAMLLLSCLWFFFRGRLQRKVLWLCGIYFVTWGSLHFYAFLIRGTIEHYPPYYLIKGFSFGFLCLILLSRELMPHFSIKKSASLLLLVLFLVLHGRIRLGNVLEDAWVWLKADSIFRQSDERCLRDLVARLEYSEASPRIFAYVPLEQAGRVEHMPELMSLVLSNAAFGTFTVADQLDVKLSTFSSRDPWKMSNPMAVDLDYFSKLWNGLSDSDKRTWVLPQSVRMPSRAVFHAVNCFDGKQTRSFRVYSNR